MTTRRRQDAKVWKAEDFEFELGAPLSGDRAVATGDGGPLQGRRVALCVCGGIAAYRTPDLLRALRKAGASCICFCTPTALTFVTAQALEWAAAGPPVVDLDGRAAHIEAPGGVAIDLWLVAPATASTIAKLAVGISDNAVTTALCAAIGQLERGKTQIAVAPAMHGSMLNSITRSHLATLANLGVEILAPRGEDGKAKLPEPAELVAQVARLLN